jgi:hypothetical protein
MIKLINQNSDADIARATAEGKIKQAARELAVSGVPTAPFTAIGNRRE